MFSRACAWEHFLLCAVFVAMYLCCLYEYVMLSYVYIVDVSCLCCGLFGHTPRFVTDTISL